MTQAEKLEALVQYALDRAWDMYDYDKWSWKVVKRVHPTTTGWYRIWVHTGGQEEWIDSERILFDKYFACALFGNGPSCAYCGEPPKNQHQPGCVEGSNIWPYLFEYHMQKAVISDDPIDYYYREVFGDDNN